jgi:hypothetical protein
LIVDLMLPWRKAAQKLFITEKMKAKSLPLLKRTDPGPERCGVRPWFPKSTFRILRVSSRNIRWPLSQDHETPGMGHVLGLLHQRY